MTTPTGPQTSLPAPSRPLAQPWVGPPVARLLPPPDGLTTFWAGHYRPLPRAVLGGSAVAGLTGGVAVVDQRPGLGLALLGLAVWLPAVPQLRRRPVADRVLAATRGLLVAVAAVRDAPWLVALALLLAVLVALVAAAGARSLTGVLLAPFTGAVAALRALPWLRTGAATVLGSRRTDVAAIARGLAATAVVLGVFGVLFAGADPVFASYLRVDVGSLPARLVVGVVVALAALTLAHLVLAPPPWSTTRLPPGRAAGRVEWLLPVVSLDVLVVGFVLVQVAALVGGHAYVEATAGLDHAEYARAGFGQLLAATALTLLVVGLAARRAPRTTLRDRVVTRAALAVLCLGTLGVVASALRRMDLYVEAFGLTRLRVLATAGEVTLGVVLLLVLVAGVRWRAGWLPAAVVQTVAVALLTLAAVNPDALIARHNTDPTLDVPLDVDYLAGLSADATPVLAALDDPLRSCVLPPADPGRSGPLEWNVGRDRAAAALRTTPPVGACTLPTGGTR